jgi:hypothetical protein
MRFADHLVSPQDILLATSQNGEVRVNVGDQASANEGVGAEVAMWGLPGFISVPSPPSSDGCAQALVLTDGNEQRVIASRDNRIAAKVGVPKSGDRFIVSDRDARVLLKNEDNAINIYTVNEEDGNASQMLDLRGKTGVTVLLNGGCIIRQKTDELIISIAEGPTFMMDKDGFQFTGKTFNVDCATITLGLLPGGFRPVPPANTALTGPTGLAAVPSSSVMIASP